MPIDDIESIRARVHPQYGLATAAHLAGTLAKLLGARSLAVELIARHDATMRRALAEATAGGYAVDLDAVLAERSEASRDIAEIDASIREVSKRLAELNANT